MPSPDVVKPDQIKTESAQLLKEIKEEINKGASKPKGWSRGSVSPYYREKFALEVKGVIDAMVGDNQDRIYFYEKFAKLPLKFSPDTLYSYVYQALRYLRTETIQGVDREYYKAVIDRIATRREKGVGVRLSFHVDIPAAFVDIAPETVEKKSTVEHLIEQINEWIDTAEAVGDEFEVTRLGLSNQEIAEIEERFQGTENFLTVSVTTKQIKLVKIA